MAQHFRLSAHSRDLSILAVARLTEDEARDVLVRLRWGGDEQICQADGCGLIEKHYWIASRKQWRCRCCGSSFSVTSNTVFADHKLPLTLLVTAMATYAQSPKGISALKLSHLLQVTHKTAWGLLHKLRETLHLTMDRTPIKGEVEVDGARFNHHIRKANWLEDRIDQRLERNQNPARAEVIVMRERGEPGEGAVRTLTAVVRRETDRDTVQAIRDVVTPGATVISDEAPIFNELAPWYRRQTVIHAQCYSNDDGVNENQAESYFARIRRSQYGEHHRLRQRACLARGHPAVDRSADLVGGDAQMPSHAARPEVSRLLAAQPPAGAYGGVAPLSGAMDQRPTLDPFCW